MNSNELKVADQPELRLARQETKIELPIGMITQLPSLAAAISFCVNLTGKAGKDFYLDLEIDAGHWTRIMQGTAHFPIDKLNALMDLCNNEVPLIWLTHSRGYGLVELKMADRAKGIIDDLLAGIGGNIPASITSYSPAAGG